MTNYKILMERAKAVSKNAYSKYSKFSVGASVLASSGNMYDGCNFENASYGLSICAERNAIGTAIASGEKTIKAIAVYSPDMQNCTPCGTCRQVIYEFKTDETVVITEKNGELLVYSIDELLPEGFVL